MNSGFVCEPPVLFVASDGILSILNGDLPLQFGVCDSDSKRCNWTVD
jgi:hypothetical protein